MVYQQDDSQQYASHAQIPTNVVKSNFLRACLICGLIKEPKQFSEYGCENCVVLNIDRNDFLESCTSPNFEGLLAIAQPQSSWVAKWQRTSMIFVILSVQFSLTH
jgi:transcription elongation factor SPT4